MKRQRVCFILAVPLSIVLAQIPLPSAPSWSSSDNDYSTGGALADLNGDGRVDLFTSNGNDMALNYNSVYINRGDSLQRVASWRSADNGYFGHCYAGDVDNDGDIDMAVAYLGAGGAGDLRVRVYRNSGTGLETSPYWRARDQHSSFDCCLGDVDLDGDLDLAISAGDAYSGEVDSARIYLNHNGLFDSLPYWTAHEGTASDAIRFCDIDNDGDLDLFVGHRRRLTMFRNNAGRLESSPSWVVTRNVGWVLRLAFGDYDGDGYQDLAAAYNDQLSDPNGVRVFHNNQGVLDTAPTFSMWSSSDYTSCVEWADIDGDGDLDLAAGGWWRPVAVFRNDAGVLNTTPAWSWQDGQNLVCEAIVFGDVRNSHLVAVTDRHDGDGSRRLFCTPHRPLQFLDSVVVDGRRVQPTEFCYDQLAGWVCFASPPPVGVGNVVLHYRYPSHPDLLVTNWDRTRGSHLFLNTTPVGIAAEPGRAILAVCPNPFRYSVRLTGDMVHRAPISIFDEAGRLVQRFDRHASESRSSCVMPDGGLRWDGRDLHGRAAEPGVYFVACGSFRIKLVKLKVD